MKFSSRKSLIVSFCASATLTLLVSCSTPTGSKITLRPVHNTVQFSGDYVEVSKCDTPPMPKSQSVPRYPVELRRAGYSGEAIVWFIVETDGRVNEIQVQDASSVEFGEAARASIAQWKFAPGRKSGQSVRTLCQITMPFTLMP